MTRQRLIYKAKIIHLLKRNPLIIAKKGILLRKSEISYGKEEKALGRHRVLNRSRF